MNQKKSAFYLLIFTCIILVSCSDRYLSFKNQYQFKSNDGKPDYSDLKYWAAHPHKRDPSDSIPLPLRNENRDTVADVFFLHPTMYTMKTESNKLNANIDDDYINAKTDYSTILYQASVFNQHARVFAPRYREAHISAYAFRDSAASYNAFNFAYNDIKKSFEYYLQHYNNDRPIIIASHSQGSTHALRLLKEFFENQPLQKKLVAAYVIGMEIPENYFKSLKMCENPTQNGCITGWRTFRKGFLPDYVKNNSLKSWVSNPLTWNSKEEYAPKSKNSGSVLYKFNKIYKSSTDAQINSGVLWVKKPKFPWSFLYFSKNYHAGDINLFYINIRENLEERIGNYLNNSTKE